VRSLIIAPIVALVVASAGCADHEAAELSRVEARVCACKDVKCAETAMADLPKASEKPSHRALSLARDMLDCYAKLNDAERPSTDPDAPQPDGSAAP
jgi:hypothetical protein